ncbi:hypothetical protein GE107_16355 [Cohnella sp. CFH 77786]|uniref:NB-ARC domain-containing protein n=1 Tax=Cohnella sp. CFH 77786 TaxID=2662265 RepID=UPI001C611106|nr:NB-ARC domain-containing protein [Cohnella sp. CFH 77786]MBW5447631.1 hypothetical protein [Cohnella sp. CFH 77786]
MDFVPFTKMEHRLMQGKLDSEVTYMYDLLYYGEMLIKLATLGMLSAVDKEKSEYSYRLKYILVRASGIGDWVQALNNLVHGPISSYIVDAALDEKRQLIEMRKTTWHFEALEHLYSALKILMPDIKENWDRMSWFDLFSRFRNKTRGHGAPTTALAAMINHHLEPSINIVAKELLIFKKEWVYLKRNFSGKYRVSPISQEGRSFNPLKSISEINIPDGVYIYFGRPCIVDLVESDVNLNDFLIANGGYSETKFELLSYITGEVKYGDPTPYKHPITELPGSETEGLRELDVRGKCFTNLPPLPHGYVERIELEEDITKILRTEDRYPIITLIGRGGIGKTSTALKVIHEITSEDRFQAVIWFSARDIDLTEDGVKQVSPRVLTIPDMAREYWRLVMDNQEAKVNIQIDKFLNDLTKSDLGPTLFVFDNFETVRDPVGTYSMLDNYIRHPNKMLITTRHREFKGDYSIEVKGMNEKEFTELVNSAVVRLSMRSLSDSEMQTIYSKSGGHPYVVKIVLGEMSKPNGGKPLESIIASREDILDALFERTYTLLSPGAKRIFLTLCNWRSNTPQLAIEAVMLRSRYQDDSFDPQEAIEELSRVSFVEISESETDNELFVSVPLAAAVYGKGKLRVDQLKPVVHTDTEFLQCFGAAQSTDIRHGIEPRIRRFFINVQQQISKRASKLDEYLPVLEFIARKYTPAWLEIARLIEKYGQSDKLSMAKEKYQKYLESAPESEETFAVWRHIADISAQLNDMKGVIHALVESCFVGNRPFGEISTVVNRFNELLRTKSLVIDYDERRFLALRLLNLIDTRIGEASAIDCSRIAWLSLNIQDESRAWTYTQIGLEKDSTDEYCISLKEKLLESGSVGI